MSAGNIRFDLTGVPLGLSLEVAATAWKKTVGWREDTENNRLVFYWVPSSASHPLPTPMQTYKLEGMITAWLAAADYGPEPDLDGSVSKGWRVYNEVWGSVGGDHMAFLAIEPVWLEYHK